jgi:hypothetical protein
MLPVGLKVPVTGSYNSALARGPVVPYPPAMRTFPFGSTVAVCSARAEDMLSVTWK